MSQSTSNPQWPICEQCGGVLWQVRREPLPTGFERQAFTCVRCGHVTERVVPGQPDDEPDDARPHAGTTATSPYQAPGDLMTRRDPTKSAPSSSIKEAEDRHPYGGVKPEPPTEKGRDIAGPQPKPALQRRRPRQQVEAPYPEPKAKTATSDGDDRHDS